MAAAVRGLAVPNGDQTAAVDRVTEEGRKRWARRKERNPCFEAREEHRALDKYRSSRRP
jgi:hypothetical protein